MDERHIQLRAADTILRKGVRVPIVSAPLFLRIFGKKRLSIVLYQPPMGGLILISRVVAQMGLTREDFEELTVDRCYKLIDEHGEGVLQIVAIAALRGMPYVRFYKLFARWLRWRIEPALLAYALRLLLTINDAGSFIASIRSITQTMNNLSPKIQGSHQAE